MRTIARRLVRAVTSTAFGGLWALFLALTGNLRWGTGLDVGFTPGVARPR